MTSRPDYKERLQRIRHLLDALAEPIGTTPPPLPHEMRLNPGTSKATLQTLHKPHPTVAAMASDGWPAAMAECGLALHRQTWSADVLAQSLESELEPLGGLEALARFAMQAGARPAYRRIIVPERMLHIWPALPGSGLTPVLYAYLLGVSEQRIRPSSRGRHFAKHVVQCAQKAGVALELVEPAGVGPLTPASAEVFDDQEKSAVEMDWDWPQVCVVSGSDATLSAVRAHLTKRPRPRRVQLTGYGHRLSLAVIVAPSKDEPPCHSDAFDAKSALEHWAHQLGFDAVMWHQSGCFSPRGVVFCGSEEQARVFSQALSQAIAYWEEQLDALVPPRSATTATDGRQGDNGRDMVEDVREDSEGHLGNGSRYLSDPGMLAARAQALGLAEFQAPHLDRAGLGWVQWSEAPFRGEWVAPHVLTLHRVENVEALHTAIDIPAHHVQGVALGCLGAPQANSYRHASPMWLTWASTLAGLGATRICAPGLLQAPPADWPHDGQSNTVHWVRQAVI